MNQIVTHVLFVGILSLNLNTLAQKPKRFIALAEQSEQANDFVGAAYYYQKAYELDSTDMSIYNRFAQALLKDNNYLKAELAFKYLYYSNNRDGFEESLFYLALCEQYNAHYALAQKNFERFARFYKGDPKLVDRANQAEKSCWFALNHLKDSSKSNITHLPQGINTIHSEFAPTLTQDSLLFFSALKWKTMNDQLKVKIDNETGVRLFQYDLSSDKEAILVDSLTQTNFNHVANFSISEKPQNGFLKLCNNLNSCALYNITYIKDSIHILEKLNPVINRDGADNTHLFEVSLGQDTFLLFSSNRDGGLGGYDLYYAIKEKGQYKKAINLGARINTPGNEVTPYYLTDSNKLFFSSDWHKGFGGFDVFMASGRFDKLSKPENLKIGINSSANDLYFNYTKGKRYGTFVSNRSSGVKLTGETCCNDMYLFSLPKSKYQADSIVIDSFPPDSHVVLIENNEAQLPAVLPQFNIYFANDEPNPRSWKETTEKACDVLLTNYKDSVINWQNDRIRNETIGLIKNSTHALKLLEKQLSKAIAEKDTVVFTIQGYASPLFASGYNLNLSKRRIHSFKNWLQSNVEFQNGLNNGLILINEQPKGEIAGLSKNLEDRKSEEAVFGLQAIKARRIEITSSVERLKKVDVR